MTAQTLSRRRVISLTPVPPLPAPKAQFDPDVDGKHQRLSLWLRKTEAIIALPLDAERRIRALERFTSAAKVRASLGEDFLISLALADAIETGDKDKIRLRRGAYLLQREDGVQNRLSRPHEVLLELTSRCNFSCPYCCLGELPTGDRRFDMKPELVAGLLQKFKAEPVFRLIVSGGEPLLWEQRYSVLFEGLPSIRAQGTYTTLFTNGVLIDQYRDQIAASFDKVVVSLDAISPDGFAKMSGRSGRELARTTKNVRDLARTSNVHLNAVVCRTNASEVTELADWAAESGVKVLNLSRQFALGRAKEGIDTNLADAEWSSLEQSLKRYGERAGCGVICIDRKQKVSETFPFGPCKVGRAYMVINYDGSVSPCIGFKSHHVGAIAEDGSLDHVWRNGEWQRYRQSDTACPVPSQQKIVVNF